MMMPDLTLEITDVRDDQRPQRDGSTITQKRVTFYLGKFGPFTERMSDEDLHGGELDRRVSLLRNTLQRTSTL